jgi:hypothetical protein
MVSLASAPSYLDRTLVGLQSADYNGLVCQVKSGLDGDGRVAAYVPSQSKSLRFRNGNLHFRPSLAQDTAFPASDRHAGAVPSPAPLTLCCRERVARDLCQDAWSLLWRSNEADDIDRAHQFAAAAVAMFPSPWTYICGADTLVALSLPQLALTWLQRAAALDHSNEYREFCASGSHQVRVPLCLCAPRICVCWWQPI